MAIFHKSLDSRSAVIFVDSRAVHDRLLPSSTRLETWRWSVLYNNSSKDDVGGARLLHQVCMEAQKEFQLLIQNQQQRCEKPQKYI